MRQSQVEADIVMDMQKCSVRRQNSFNWTMLPICKYRLVGIREARQAFKALQWVISNTAHTWLIYLLLVKFNTGLYGRQDRLKALQWVVW